MDAPNFQSADYYDLVYRDKRDYPEIARYVHELIERRRRCYHTPTLWRGTLLDAACGTGKPAEYLSQWYTIDGVDLNRVFLDKMRERVKATLYLDNVAYFRNGKLYDVVVWLDGGTAHFHTIAALNRAVQNLGKHLKIGGVMLIQPWHPPSPDSYLGAIADGAHDETTGVGVARVSTLISVDPYRTLFDHVLTYSVARPDGRGGCQQSQFIETSRLKMHKLNDVVAAMNLAGLDVVVEPKGCLRQSPLVGVKTQLGVRQVGTQRALLTQEYRG